MIVFCVNDGAVMSAWSEDQGVDKSDLITMMGDPSGALTRSLEMEILDPGPVKVLGPGRSKRFALYAEDGVIKWVEIADSPGDPAGDDHPEVTLAPAVIDGIKRYRAALAKKAEL